MSPATRADLLEHVEARTGWVLRLAVLNLLVLGVSVAATALAAFPGFLALGATWMFIAVRISRGVVGRAGPPEPPRLRDLAAAQQVLPLDLQASLSTSQEHRHRMLQLSAAAALVHGLGALSGLAPGAAPWLFGVALVFDIAALGWAWSRRSAWRAAHQQVEAGAA